MITMQTITAIGLIYLIGINLAGFIIMGVDKKKSHPGCLAHLGGFSFFNGAIGWQPGMYSGNAAFPPQDETLVFQIRNAGDPGGTGTAFCPFIQVGVMLY